MRIGNTSIPIENPIPAVASNLAYAVVAVIVPLFGGWAATPVALGLVLQCFGSTLYHATGDAWWAQVADAVGIQCTFSALLALAIYAQTGSPLIFAALVVLWPIWWFYVDRVSRVGAGGIQAVIVLALALKGGAVSGVIVLLMLMAAAAVFQWLGTSHSVEHSIWHLLTASAQLGTVLLFV